MGPIEIPWALSILAGNSPDTVVTGLEDIPPADRAPPLVRAFFQAMVLSGILLGGHAVWSAWNWIRRRPPSGRFLRATALVGPLGFLALEAGWIVTEVGRQPWVIYGVMRTADAVTPMRGLVVPFIAVSVVYLLLSAVVIEILRRQFREAQ